MVEAVPGKQGAVLAEIKGERGAFCPGMIVATVSH